MAERQKLTILQVKDVQKVGEKQREKLQFQARDATGKELWYFTFRTSLFDAIRNNKEIEVDVDISSHEYDGTTYWDRNISQVYIAGKPVAEKGTGGRQWSGKSPEEIASIETQVAVKAVVDLLIAGDLNENSPEVLGMRAWVCKQLGIRAVAPTTVEEAVPKAVPDKSQERIIASGGVDMSPIKNKGDLFTRCKKYFDLNKSQALDKLGGQWEIDLENLDDSWHQVCTVMKVEKEK